MNQTADKPMNPESAHVAEREEPAFATLLATNAGRRFVLGKDELYLLDVFDISRRCEEVPCQFWW